MVTDAGSEFGPSQRLVFTPAKTMPRKKVDDSNRRRCAKACDHCKRRKERCNGLQPCGRCLIRGVDGECHFSLGPASANSNQTSSHSPDEQGVTVNDTQEPVTCAPDLTAKHSDDVLGSPHRQGRRRSSVVPVPQLSRLVRGAKGKFMFIGDSANLSFLQNIRRLVRTSIGPCDFTTDPLKFMMVETSPDGQPHWIDGGLRGPPTKPSLEEAAYLIRRYMIATNCVLDLFDEPDLLNHLPQWLGIVAEESSIPSSTYYLILAIGAQTCPEDKDEVADVYFNYGRYLTALSCMEDPSITTIQCYVMITMYMLGASRRNAAFMNLGLAVRAAYALGLHRRDISRLFPQSEYKTRERLWKAVRILDLFMSASLGRPPSTSETRDTTEVENYSASVDLCSIFESVLNDVYSKRMVSTEILEKISEMHRWWTARFHHGLLNDGIQPDDTLDDGALPNIGLYHMKEAYYWTIILLTRPFFIESISTHIENSAAKPGHELDTAPALLSNKDLVHACVDSAIRTVELLRGLLGNEGIPKRLPFIVNSIFNSALVVGIALFGDLDGTFPLERNLQAAQRLLRLFLSDALARRNLMIVEYLQLACETYIEQRARRRMELHGQLVGGIFGKIDDGRSTSSQREHPTHRQLQVEQPFADVQGTPDSGQDPNHRPDSNPIVDVIPFSEISSFLPEHPNMDHLGTSMDHILSNWGHSYNNNPILPTSPRTLWFESYEENMPLFATVDTTMIDT